MKRLDGFALAVAAVLAAVAPAAAQDTLKLVIGQINNWENQAPTLGQDAGIFKKRGLVLENFGTQGAGETMQAVIAGSADIGAGVGVAGVMRAFSRGAPVRILAPMFTGTGDHLLVREGGFADQERSRTRPTKQHDRVFDQRLDLRQDRRRLRAGARRQGEADQDRRPARRPTRRSCPARSISAGRRRRSA